MKTYIILFCVFAWSNLAFSQNTDSINFLSRLDTFGLHTAESIIEYEQTVLNSKILLADSLLISFFKKALDAAQKIDSDSLSRNYASVLSQKYSQSTEQNSSLALKYAELSLKHAKDSGEKSSISTSRIVLGNYYYNISEFSKATKYYLNALADFPSSEDYLNLSSMYLNIGNCYWQLGDLENAIKYAQISILNSKKIAMPDQAQGLAFGYISLQSYYKQLNQTDSLEYYLEKAIQCSEQLNVINENGSYNYIIGDVSLQAAQFHLSQNNLEKADYFLKNPFIKPYFLEYYYITSIDYAVRKNDLKTATEQVKNLPARLFVENKKMYNWNIYFYSVLANYYEKVGMNNFSLEYYKRLKDVEITRLQADKIKRTAYADAKMETIKQTNRVERLEQMQILSESRSNGLITVMSLITLFLCLALYSIYEMRKNLKRQQIIKEQAKQLLLINHQKSALFVNIAHELQTPLLLIEGLGKQVLKSLQSKSRQEEQMKIIIKNSNELIQTTEQILDLSKSEEKSLKTYPELFYLKDLIDYISPEYKILTKNKNIEFIISEKGDMSLPIYTDIKKLKTVIKNLISNAIKYTPYGGKIELTYTNLDEKLIQINVKDNGRGIAKEELPMVFTRYYQSAKLKPEGGVGIGLAICNLYTNLLNGKITVKSTLETGSNFAVLIPQFFKSPTPNAEIFHFPVKDIQNSKLSSPSLMVTQKKVILIVEDNLDFCKYLQIILQDDYSLSVVNNGREALLSLEKNIPDIIITDWMMPEIDGIELIKTLKERQEYQYIPILLLTARNILSDKLKALRVGVDDYITKQFEEEHLKSRLADLINRVKEKRAQAHSLTTLQGENSISSVRIQQEVDIPIQSQDWLLKLESHIYPHVGNFDLKSEMIAQKMQLSTKQLNRRLKILTGLTTVKYIQEVRFWEARRMLEVREYDSVKAVALSVGYKDRHNFSKIFKERFGKNPVDFLLV